MRLHEVLRSDLKAIEGLLERMEFEARQIRALISTTRLLADDVQTLEEEDPLAPGPDAEVRMMPSWEDGSERYLATYRGESIDDPRPAPDAEEPDATGLAIVALAAVVDGLVCRAQLPMGTHQAPVAECACRTCETARVLCAALERLGAA